ncbi:hypothetical protein LCGC14_0922420 [marine sediment metagenome]|uniref:Uncharacterized protein n=1 Tax=marine sediment metagenome TaxID=412755 RepID=A0A0F9PAZ0_9ZZZZ
MIELPANPYKALKLTEGLYLHQTTKFQVYAQSQKDTLRWLGDNMISRATAGFKALPDGEDGLRKGYWQAYMDIGQELVDKLAELECE